MSGNSFPNKEKGGTTKQKHSPQTDIADDDYAEDKVQQSDYESMFGDKYVGFMEREHGKFGSISLYDDYGDESDAEG